MPSVAEAVLGTQLRSWGLPASRPSQHLASAVWVPDCTSGERESVWPSFGLVTNISWPSVTEPRPGGRGLSRQMDLMIILLLQRGEMEMLGVRDGGQGTTGALPDPFNQKVMPDCGTQQPVLYQTILLEATGVGELCVSGLGGDRMDVWLSSMFRK